MPIVDNIGQLGLLSDLAPAELPINGLSNGANIRCKDGYAERMLGQAAIFGAPTVAPLFLQPLTRDTARYWVYASTAKIYVTDGVTHTNITRTVGGDYTGTIANKWTGGAFNGVAVLNNGVDMPQFWGGVPATPCAALTGFDTTWRALSIRPFKNFLIACNLTESSVARPQRIRWSALAEAGTLPSWTPLPSNEAGDQDLTESDGAVVDSLQLNDMHIVYKQDSYYSLNFVGGNDIFRITRLENQFGILSQNCAAQFPNGHIVLGNGEVYIHNGGAARPILTGRMRDWLFNQIDSTNFKACFVTTNPKKNEAWICFPEVGKTACSKALVWNWQADAFGVRDLPDCYHGNTGLINYVVGDSWDVNTDPWDTVTRAWDSNAYSQAESRLLLAGGSIHLTEINSTFNGTNYASIIERTGIDFGDPASVKTAKSLQPNFDTPDGQVFKIQLGGQMVANGAIAWCPEITYTKGVDTKAFCFATGRFLAYRIKKESGAAFRLKRLDMDVTLRGGY